MLVREIVVAANMDKEAPLNVSTGGTPAVVILAVVDVTEAAPDPVPAVNAPLKVSAPLELIVTVFPDPDSKSKIPKVTVVPFTAFVWTVTFPAPGLKVTGAPLKLMELAAESNVTAPLPLLKVMTPTELPAMLPVAVVPLNVQVPGEE
jgi:hypothetical protein